MESFPFRFGSYELIDLLAVGGMGEVFRARVAGRQPDINKLIAVKRILPAYSKNENFIRLFEKEISLALSLSHPNLVKIFDYGVVKDQYFMAMEYVHGKSLEALVNHCIKMNIPIPVDFCCYVIREVCLALHYAHTLKDKVSGKYVGIIHRDISPQNIIFSYAGKVKLFDFGVAKLVARDTSTVGALKGKPSYVSPEQVKGEELDGRTDIFSLGVVFWELLTKQRLFYADQPLQAIKSILEKSIEAPSSLNHAVSRVLDGIVSKALERDLNSRYPSAQAIAADVDNFLKTISPGYGERQAAEFIKLAFGALIDHENEILAAKVDVESSASPQEDGIEIGPSPISGDQPRRGPDAFSAHAMNIPEFRGITLDESSLSQGIEVQKPTIPEPEWRRARPPLPGNIAKSPVGLESNTRMPPPTESSFPYRIPVIALILLLVGLGGQDWFFKWYFEKKVNPEPPTMAPARAIASTVAKAPVAISPVEQKVPAGCDEKSKPVCAFSNGLPTTYPTSCAAEEAKSIFLYVGSCDEKMNPEVRFKDVRLLDIKWRATTSGNDRAATYGDSLEISLETVNIPSSLRLQVALIQLGAKKDVRIKDMLTISTVMTLSDDLASGKYDLEVRVVDKQGNVFFTRPANRPFFLGNSSSVKARLYEL